MTTFLLDANTLIALTVIEHEHHDAAATGLLRNVDTIPLWLQLIHRGNLENGLTSASVRFSMDLEKEFGIPGPTRINVVRSIFFALKHRLVKPPMRMVRRVVRRVLQG